MLLKYEIKQKSPMPHVTGLSYNNKKWTIVSDATDCLGNEYDTVHIAFQNNLFLFLILSNNARKKRIIIFTDQLTKSDLHQLLFVVNQI